MTIAHEDRVRLVELAREALAAEICGTSWPQDGQGKLSGILAQQRGCFVTLTNGGELRGCIGTFFPRSPLAELVVEMATEAARDPRFVWNPITAGELPKLKVEVSVLSPLERTAQPHKLELGKHGIYIVRDGQAGCFLPEVAIEAGWSVQEFLDYCCTHKAALPQGAWRDPATAVYLFTSEKFSD